MTTLRNTSFMSEGSRMTTATLEERERSERYQTGAELFTDPAQFWEGMIKAMKEEAMITEIYRMLAGTLPGPREPDPIAIELRERERWLERNGAKEAVPEVANTNEPPTDPTSEAG